jgi:hypothetical protein
MRLRVGFHRCLPTVATRAPCGPRRPLARTLVDVRRLRGRRAQRARARRAREGPRVAERRALIRPTRKVAAGCRKVAISSARRPCWPAVPLDSKRTSRPTPRPWRPHRLELGRSTGTASLPPATPIPINPGRGPEKRNPRSCAGIADRERCRPPSGTPAPPSGERSRFRGHRDHLGRSTAATHTPQTQMDAAGQTRKPLQNGFRRRRKARWPHHTYCIGACAIPRRVDACRGRVLLGR